MARYYSTNGTAVVYADRILPGGLSAEGLSATIGKAMLVAEIPRLPALPKSGIFQSRVGASTRDSWCACQQFDNEESTIDMTLLYYNIVLDRHEASQIPNPTM